MTRRFRQYPGHSQAILRPSPGNVQAIPLPDHYHSGTMILSYPMHSTHPGSANKKSTSLYARCLQNNVYSNTLDRYWNVFVFQ